MWQLHEGTIGIIGKMNHISICLVKLREGLVVKISPFCYFFDNYLEVSAFLRIFVAEY